MIGFSEITSERSQSYSFEQLRKMKEIEKAPLFFSQRLLLATMAFLGKAIVYASRYNLSIAIVCMVRGQMDNSSASGISDASHWSNATVSANSSMPEPGACGGRDDEDTNAKSNENAEFDWDRTTTSNLLAMYFYGYLFLQIPGGWLASRYGGKRVWGVCQAVSAVCTLLTPVCARTSVYLTCALRFILGFVAAVTFPCVHALLGQWSPPVERSKMVGCTFSGAVVGNVVTFALSGLLCAYGFDNGWGSIFYLTGVLNLVWVVAWFWLVADSPGKHKHISEKEQVYITASIGKGLVKDVTGAPWLAILQSGPVWAIVIAQVCSNYILETQSILLPTYMKESLNFDIKANGALSALPFLFQFVMTFVIGYVADTIIERCHISTKTVRKTFQTIALSGSTLCVLVISQLGCELRYMAVAMLCLNTSFLSARTAGYNSNHLDLAPSYAGILYGVSNCVSTIGAVLAPVVAGSLTLNGTTDEWRNVFYVCAGVAVLGMVLYLILADGELQPWAVSQDDDHTMPAKMKLMSEDEDNSGKEINIKDAEFEKETLKTEASLM